VSTISLGEIVKYLGPIAPSGIARDSARKTARRARSTHARRVIDRADLQAWLIPDAAE